jgi:hypothetical protein
MKKTLLILLCIPFCIPFVFMSGLGYGFIAQKLVGNREPWYTLCLLGGFATTIALLTWATGTPTTWAVSAFAGTGVLYLALRLLCGSSSALEMLVPTHILAILAMLSWPAYEKNQKIKQPGLQLHRSAGQPSVEYADHLHTGLAVIREG